MRRIICALLCALVFTAAPVRAEDENDLIEDIGDVVQFLIPITAATVPTIKRDWEGLKQFGFSFGSTVATVGVFKLVADKRRPNESNNLSYPSGHSAAAFSGASFLQSRYGAAYGVPAYAAALFVGYSRIQSDQHYTDDVLAGASVALLYNWALVRRHPEKLSFKMQKQGQQGYAFGMTWRPDLEEGYFLAAPEKFHAQFRFIAEFSATWTSSAKFQAPRSTGDLIQLDQDFGNVDEPVSSTYAQFQWFITERHELDFVLSPFEERDFGTFDSAKRFDGKLFPADINTRSAYSVYQFRVRYRFNVLADPESKWVLKLSAGIAVSYWNVALKSDAGPVGEVDQWDILPVVGLVFGFKFTEKWSLVGEIDGMYVGDGHFVDTSIWVAWQFGQQWELRFGVRYLDQAIDVADLKADFEQNRFYVAFGFRW